ncbi:MAG: glycosyltransferase [bacterium F082]|nr:MAG: glycosyltransferase [bacterium F082]KWW31120.1 MAG: glycosyltransferase [bacterium P201]
MIPKIIHYCWFGHGPMPELALKCIESWHHHMPDYEYKLWDEDSFDVNIVPYTKEAYEAHKYAFVSDYVRLWALYHEGGVYLDVDFLVYKPFDDLLHWDAFAGFEGSKHMPLMMGVIASVPKGEWVNEQLEAYDNRRFIKQDGTCDLTTNVSFVSSVMRKHGFVQNGMEQNYKDLHVFPVECFCPRQTTGEYYRTVNTYCESKGLGSWSNQKGTKKWKNEVLRALGLKNRIKLIKLKRKLLG